VCIAVALDIALPIRFECRLPASAGIPQVIGHHCLMLCF
jgi:hypothetical protein